MPFTNLSVIQSRQSMLRSPLKYGYKAAMGTKTTIQSANSIKR